MMLQLYEQKYDGLILFLLTQIHCFQGYMNAGF